METSLIVLLPQCNLLNASEVAIDTEKINLIYR